MLTTSPRGIRYGALKVLAPLEILCNSPAIEWEGGQSSLLSHKQTLAAAYMICRR